MATFRVDIKTDEGDAMVDLIFEVANILHDLGNRVIDNGIGYVFRLRDSNGNTVGKAELVPDDE